jgi:hypothetical protein
MASTGCTGPESHFARDMASTGYSSKGHFARGISSLNIGSCKNVWSFKF